MAGIAARNPVEHSRDMEALSEALSPIHERLNVHGEMLGHIVRLLTEEKPSDGPSLYELLADLIARIDDQSRYLKDLTVAVGRLGIELPLEIVRAIDDNLALPSPDGGERNGGVDGLPQA